MRGQRKNRGWYRCIVVSSLSCWLPHTGRGARIRDVRMHGIVMDFDSVSFKEFIAYSARDKVEDWVILGVEVTLMNRP